VYNQVNGPALITTQYTSHSIAYDFSTKERAVVFATQNHDTISRTSPEVKLPNPMTRKRLLHCLNELE
jgi:hypothetical protein